MVFAPSQVHLRDIVSELGPALRGAACGVDDGATRRVVVRLGGAHRLDNAMNHEVNVDVLARRRGVVVGL